MKKTTKTRLTQEKPTPLLFLLLTGLSLMLFSCQKTKYPWQPGISAPKYYPVAGHIDFGNAGNGSNTSFANGWGSQYGSVVSGAKNKEIPRQVYIDYYSVVDGKGFNGKVILPQEKIRNLFKQYNVRQDYWAHLVVGMAPGGWIRVWFTTIDAQIEVAKAKLKAYKDETVGKGLKTKTYEEWGSTYTYWQHHGVPYSAWAQNEKEYDLYFDFNRPNHREVGFSYVSKDGTFEQGIGIWKKFHRKLPVEMELSWAGASEEVYCCKIIIPKKFKDYIEQKKLKMVILQLVIEKDDEHAILYLVSNGIKEKLLRFKNRRPTAEENKEQDYDYSQEVEYFIQ